MENVFPSSLARDDNRMIDILNLPRLRVLEMEDEPDQYTIHAESDATPFKCDKCNRMKFYAHGVRRQVYMDTPSHGKMVAIVVDRKRFRCTECGAVTLQPLSDMHSDHQMTTRLVEYVEANSLRRTFADVAKETGMNEKTIRRITGDYIKRLEAAHKFQTPIWLDLDEIYIIKKARGVVANVKDRCMIDMLPDRNKITIGNYINNVLDRSKIEIVTMDMWVPYRSVARELCPKAQVVVDKFHVVRMASDALNNVRKSLRGSLTTRARLKLKDDRHVLNMRFDKLDQRQRTLIQLWSDEHPILGKAWVAKESFFDIWDCKTAQEAKDCYAIWRDRLPPELAETFRPLVTALGNWETEVFAHFDHGATNAYVEALNSVIRVVNRMGRGYSFDVLCARMLFAHGQQQAPRRIQKRHEAFFGKVGFGDFANFLGADYDEPDGPDEVGVPLSVLADMIADGRI